MQSVTESDYDEFSLFHENLSEWDLDVAGTARAPILRGRRRTASGERSPVGRRRRPSWCSCTAAHRTPTRTTPSPWRCSARSSRSTCRVTATPTHRPTAARRCAVTRPTSSATLEQLLDGALPLVGMSLGGLVALVVAHERPDLVRSPALIDITPGVNADKARHITDFVNGPTSFDDFDALLAGRSSTTPRVRSSSLRRGILHNAVQRDDGTWVWRHQRHPTPNWWRPTSATSGRCSASS